MQEGAAQGPPERLGAQCGGELPGVPRERLGAQRCRSCLQGHVSCLGQDGGSDLLRWGAAHEGQ